MATSRVGTIRNLESGGSYDLLLIKVNGTYPEGEIKFGFYDVPMKITGLQKVVQVFLKVLLTTKGSDTFYPNRGTFFSTYTINANQLIDDNALLSDISDAIKDCEDQVRTILNVNVADSTSTLDSVEIIGLEKITEGILLYLQVKTLAGEFASVAVPFPEFGLN